MKPLQTQHFSLAGDEIARKCTFCKAMQAHGLVGQSDNYGGKRGALEHRGDSMSLGEAQGLEEAPHIALGFKRYLWGCPLIPDQTSPQINWHFSFITKLTRTKLSFLTKLTKLHHK